MDKKQLLIRIYKTQIKKYIPDLLVVIFFMMITGASTAAVAWLLDPAIKKIFLEKDKTMLLLIPAGIIIAFFAKSVSLYITRIKSIQISYKIKESIQKSLAEKILSSDTSFLIDHHSGKFIANFNEDTRLLQNVTQTVALSSLKEFITLIFLISLMLSKDLFLSILAFTIIPFAGYISKRLGRRMGKAVSGALEANESFIKYLSEILKSVFLIKIFQKENDEIKNLTNYIRKLIEKSMKVEKTRLGTAPLMDSITGIAVAIVVFAGGYQSINGDLEVGSFFSFLTALMLAYQPVRTLAGLNIGLNEGFAAATRIYKLLDNKILIKNKENATELNLVNGQINFVNVSMRYHQGEEVLNKINISIPGKKKIALVGPSGGGKTTILNLIPRFYDVTGGYIEVDGQKIKDITIQSLRKQIALVSQDTILFDDTIKNNLLYGNSAANNSEIEKACEMANCHEFIKNFDRGYDTIVGESGVKLSGGQKQRISIARAILKKSPIILLDEATSALDTESERKVQIAINNLSENKTTITIAHRLSTVKNCDLIYVIEKGQVVEKGSHLELIEKNGLYKKLCDQQSL